MGPMVYAETSVRNYHYSLRNNPEERSSKLLRDGSLKSRTEQREAISVWRSGGAFPVRPVLNLNINSGLVFSFTPWLL